MATSRTLCSECSRVAGPAARHRRGRGGLHGPGPAGGAIIGSDAAARCRAGSARRGDRAVRMRGAMVPEPGVLASVRHECPCAYRATGQADVPDRGPRMPAAHHRRRLLEDPALAGRPLPSRRGHPSQRSHAVALARLRPGIYFATPSSSSTSSRVGSVSSATGPPGRQAVTATRNTPARVTGTTRMSRTTA